MTRPAASTSGQCLTCSWTEGPTTDRHGLKSRASWHARRLKHRVIVCDVNYTTYEARP